MAANPEAPLRPIIPAPEDVPRSSRVRSALFAIAALAAGLYGLVLVLLGFTLGNCAAFGGRCGDDPPSILDDDVFGMAFAGIVLLAAGPVISHWRKTRQVWSMLVSVGIASTVGLIARASGY